MQEINEVGKKQSEAKKRKAEATLKPYLEETKETTENAPNKMSPPASTPPAPENFKRQKTQELDSDEEVIDTSTPKK